MNIIDLLDPSVIFTPLGIVRIVSIGLTLITILTLTLLSFLVARKTQLLNSIVKTPLAWLYLIGAILFFGVCIGTLVTSIKLWINPLIFG